MGAQKPTIQGAPGTQKPPQGNHFPFPIPHASQAQADGGPYPNSLRQSADLMPQALQRGVPSSASRQSGVLWVLQEAQRLGPEKAEAKGQESEAKRPGSGGWCGVGKSGRISVKAPPGSGPVPGCCHI